MARGTREVTRQRLVEAAAATFAERGYAGSSVDAIAERAGLTTGALYSNFEGKRELFLMALRSAVGQQIDTRPATLPGDAATHIRAGSRFLRSLDRDPTGFRLLLWAVLEAANDDEVREVVVSVLAEQRDIQAHFVGELPGSQTRRWQADRATELSALAIGGGIQRLVDPGRVSSAQLVRILTERVTQVAATATAEPVPEPRHP